MPKDKRLLNLSNKVHVLNTEVSHLQAEMDNLRQDMEGQSDEIDVIDERLDVISSDIQEIEQWVSSEERQQRIDQKKRIKSELQKESDWRSFWIAVISALLGAFSAGLLQWLFL